jgi:hypothetical protein
MAMELTLLVLGLPFYPEDEAKRSRYNTGNHLPDSKLMGFWALSIIQYSKN